MYQVVIEKQAQKQLAKISPPWYQNVVEALQGLATNPGHMGIKNLKAGLAFAFVLAIIASFTILKTTSSLFLCSAPATEKIFMNSKVVDCRTASLFIMWS